MARIATKYVDWKIFVDGIEIPWISFSVSVGVWNGGGASILIEPDLHLQRHIRPTSLVHIFLYDDLETKGDDWDKYKLWWEGEISGYNTTKSGTSRNVSIDCMGLISYLQKTQMSALGIGSIANTHILTGSTLLRETSAATLAIRKEIIPVELSSEGDGKDLPDGVTLNFGERVLNVLAYLLSFNAVGRLNTVRRDIFGKITTITDASIGRMIPRVVAQPFFDQALSGLSGGGSLLDLVKTMSGALFYDLVSTTGPVKRNVGGGATTEVSRYHYLGTDPLEKKENLYSIPAFNFRNDYFFTPKIYYAFPPACNIIFPEFISNISLSRTFFDDPTRVVLSTTLGVNLSVVAPDSIFRFTERTMTPGEFWSNNADGIKKLGEEESPYINSGLNLFAAASDIEIERGILAPQFSPDFEVFSAISNLFDLRQEGDINRMQNILKKMGNIAKASGKVDELFASKERSYVYALKAIADYYYKLERFKRTVSLQMDGHRWLVPGLPCTIFDTDQSYVALLTSHTFAVDAEGNETSAIALNYVRPFPELDSIFVKNLEREQGKLVENEKNLRSLETAVENRKKGTTDQLKALVKVLDDIAGLRSRAQQRIADATSPRLTDAAHADLRKVELRTQVAMQDFQRSVELQGFIRSAVNIYNDAKVDPDTKVNVSGMESSLQVLNSRRVLGTVGEAIRVREEIGFSAVEVRAAMRTLGTGIDTYYDERVELAQKATVELSSQIPAIYGVGDETSKLSTSISQTEFEEADWAEDFFAPPVFANLDLIDLKKTSKFYKDLIGSKSIAEGKGGKRTDPNVASLKIEAYRRFLEFTDEMKKIFPIDKSVTKGNTEWGRRIDRPEEAQSVRRWEEKEYLRREGLLSLNEFTKMYRLKIETDTSEEPTIVEFLKLTPSPQDGNSIFDKIVDEFALYPRDVRIKKGDTWEKRHLDRDPQIEKLRQNVLKNATTDPAAIFRNNASMLFAKNRQALILNFSRRHFGARAFDGR